MSLSVNLNLSPEFIAWVWCSLPAINKPSPTKFDHLWHCDLNQISAELSYQERRVKEKNMVQSALLKELRDAARAERVREFNEIKELLGLI